MSRRAIDVSKLPPLAFGHRGIMWWGTQGLIAIEGTVFALMIVSYLFLRGRSPEWPPGGGAPPALLWGTLNTAVLLASTVPNGLAKKAAERFDLSRARRWLAAALAFALLFNVLRVFEFQALNVWWDENAYGSAVWTLLGLHTAHILTDFVDSAVLLALLFKGPLDETHFVDISENAMYWYFVVFSWMPIYAVIYLAPRIL